MSIQKYITAAREPSPAFAEISAMLESMHQQIDKLGEILAVASATIKKADARSGTPEQPAPAINRALLAGMFPHEGTH